MTNMPQSAGGIILNREGKILLVEQHGNSWSLPKGGVEEGEALADAARREIAEETGITELELLGELGSYERRSIGKDGIGENPDWPMRRRTIFLFRAMQDAAAPDDPDGEITGVRWVTVGEAARLLTHPKDRAFLEKIKDQIPNIKG